MRQPIIAGNWKMHKTGPETQEFMTQFLPLVAGVEHCEIVLCPPYTALSVIAAASQGTNIAFGAQNMHWELQGAFTGEVSAGMLKAAGCKYVILGHSERREYFGESDAVVNRKVKTALANALLPILCVGEKLEHREAGSTQQVVKGQLLGSLAGIAAVDVSKMVLAYEPIWAIGTGRTATSSDAEEVIAFIRAEVGALVGSAAAEAVRIQYGGSVKPDNAAELMAMPNIDGALVGGASLEPASFAKLVRYK